MTATSLEGPQAARAARNAVRELLADAPPEFAEVAVLLTSELVANAVTHAPGSSRLEATVEGDCLHVRVDDEVSELPVLRRASAVRDGGRGMVIVDHLANAWGVERRSGGGKSVWFDLRFRPG